MYCYLASKPTQIFKQIPIINLCWLCLFLFLGISRLIFKLIVHISYLKTFDIEIIFLQYFGQSVEDSRMILYIDNR